MEIMKLFFTKSIKYNPLLPLLYFIVHISYGIRILRGLFWGRAKGVGKVKIFGLNKDGEAYH